jgi:rRNA processing protein Gar1
VRGKENLQRIGRVLHLSSSKNLILKAENLPRIGEKVLDENLKQVGIVFDIFGPVSSPYITVKPQIKDAEKLVNQVLYAPSNKGGKGRKNE